MTPMPTTNTDITHCILHHREFPFLTECPECARERAAMMDAERASRAHRERLQIEPGVNILRDDPEVWEAERARKQATLAFWTFYLLGLAFAGWCFGYWRGWWFWPF